MAIANNPAKPSFQNTVLALEISGVDLKELQFFYNLTGSNTNQFYKLYKRSMLRSSQHIAMKRI
jgi:hypothetical protein